MAKKADKPYKWSFCKIGGVTRVNITKGEDIVHLGELDKKLWTVLSCPKSDLEFDKATLSILDDDNDGTIQVKEVVDAAQWLTSVIKDPELLVKSEDGVPFSAINDSVEEGAALLDCAKKILVGSGSDKTSISIADTDDSLALFCKNPFNGDGIVTEASAEDEKVKKAIASVIAAEGSVDDRSGDAGINQDILDKFAADCADYAAWKAAGEADAAIVFPYGDNTEAALVACDAVKEKIADYFMRCKLAAFNYDSAKALDVSAEKIGEIGSRNLAECAADIALFPLAKVNERAVLDLGAVNPAWKDAFDNVKSLVLKPDCKSIDEAQWHAVVDKFAPYIAWKDSKKGGEVESLGLDYVKEFNDSDLKKSIEALIEKDKEAAPAFDSLKNVDKLVHLYRYFFDFLRNFVVLSDFYNLDKKAVFQAGKLYIDQRCCDLCVKVTNMGAQAGMSSLSGLFLLYCKCVSKVTGESMDIAAAVTVGDTGNLRPGKHGLFYDREGACWNATVTQVVDNPISVGQSFFTPYRKLASTVENFVNKTASEKESKNLADLDTKVTALPGDAVDAAAASKKPSFDIGKFAGIFAAVGMAVGFITAALTALLAIFVKMAWWKILIVIALIIFLVSLPSMILAWMKLRKRNIAPLLNANGWAVNANAKVNIPFGNTLTSIAKYPKVSGKDPYRKKVPVWRLIIRWLLIVLIVGYFVCSAVPYTRNYMGKYAFSLKKKAPVEQVEAEAEDEAEAVAEDVAAEPAAEPAE